MIRLSHIEKTYFGKGNETHALKNVNLIMNCVQLWGQAVLGKVHYYI